MGLAQNSPLIHPHLHVERFVDRDARSLEQLRVVAGRIERQHDRQPSHQRDGQWTEGVLAFKLRGLICPVVWPFQIQSAKLSSLPRIGIVTSIVDRISLERLTYFGEFRQP